MSTQHQVPVCLTTVIDHLTWPDFLFRLPRLPPFLSEYPVGLSTLLSDSLPDFLSVCLSTRLSA